MLTKYQYPNFFFNCSNKTKKYIQTLTHATTRTADTHTSLTAVVRRKERKKNGEYRWKTNKQQQTKFETNYFGWSDRFSFPVSSTKIPCNSIRKERMACFRFRVCVCVYAPCVCRCVLCACVCRIPNFVRRCFDFPCRKITTIN